MIIVTITIDATNGFEVEDGTGSVTSSAEGSESKS